MGLPGPARNSAGKNQRRLLRLQPEEVEFLILTVIRSLFSEAEPGSAGGFAARMASVGFAVTRR